MIELISLITFIAFSFIIRRFVWCDKRLIYVNEKDLKRFKYLDRMIERKNDFTII